MLDLKDQGFPLESSFYGRVRNLSLPANASNSLIPLFEALMNAIHSIEDKFGSDNLSKGSIIIRLQRVDGRISGYRVADNGIGLTDDNLKSFFTSDSRYKEDRGGKGVGRLSWLKACETSHIHSRHEEQGRIVETNFDFRLEEQNQVHRFSQKEVSERGPITGTIVNLHPLKLSYSLKCPRKLETISSKIISHFLPYFLTTNVPQIVIEDDDEGSAFDLTEITSSLQNEEREYDVSVTGENGEAHSFKIDCFKIDKKLADDESGLNAVYYIADSRVVKRVSLDTALGLKVIGSNQAFCATVTGEYANKVANQERTSFNWSDDFFKKLHVQVVDVAKEYLSDEIKSIRKNQAAKISNLADEHMRFLPYKKDADKIAKSLALSVNSNEEIFLELSRKGLREYKAARSDYRRSLKSREALDEKAKEFVENLQSDALGSLAECVYKRKLILSLLDERMEYVDEEAKKHALEEAVHEVICPLGGDADSIPYDEHNLWILDDNLAFYTYFGSDQKITKVTEGQIESAKEPDLVFFDLGLGFERKRSDQPITIIEFKRPGRKQYSASDNPITQVRNYVDEMRKSKAAVTDKGRQVMAVDDNTPFHCHIVADITPKLQKQMKDYGTFAQRAGRNSYYKWDEPYGIMIEISSYEEVIRSAKARHEEFFKKLGVDV